MTPRARQVVGATLMVVTVLVGVCGSVATPAGSGAGKVLYLVLLGGIVGALVLLLSGRKGGAPGAPAAPPERPADAHGLLWSDDDRLHLAPVPLEQHLDKESASLPEAAHRAFAAAVEFGNSERPAEALAQYEAALALAPRARFPAWTTEFVVGRARCFLDLEKPAEAVAALSVLVQRGQALLGLRSGAMAGVLGTFAQAFAGLGNADQAERCSNLAMGLLVDTDFRDQPLTDLVMRQRVLTFKALLASVPALRVLEVLEKQARLVGPLTVEMVGGYHAVLALQKLGRHRAAQALARTLLDVAREGKLSDEVPSRLRQALAELTPDSTDDPRDLSSGLERRRRVEFELGEQLFAAGERGDLAALQRLAAQPPGLDAGGKEWRTALQAAAVAGHLDAVRWLLDHGASVDATDADSWSPLAFAAAQGHAQVVELLLSRGALVGRRDAQLATPLHQAAGAGAVPVLEVLLNAKAKVEARTFLGHTPLHAAAATGQVDAVKALLARGAQANALDRAGKTPAALARQFGHPAVLPWLERTAARAG